MANTQKVLLTGASGYIGGAVLVDIIRSKLPVEISALVRSIESRDAIKSLGITPIHFDGLDDTKAIEDIASGHDIVISCASSMHEASCLALINGLRKRKQHTGSEVYYIHTSGTSNFGDHPISGNVVNLGALSDQDDVYAIEKEHADDWITCKVDVAVIDAGERLGVKTAIVNSPLIYGTGSGPVHKRSIQIPALIRVGLQQGQAIVLGEGRGIWNFIHVSDVANFYTTLLNRILSGSSVSFGRKAYYFVEGGEINWRTISEQIAKAGLSQGYFSSDEVHQISPEEMNDSMGLSFLNPYLVEVIWGSNARITGVQSRSLGWQPRFGAEDFRISFAEEFKEVARSG
ncbi:NAD dependent epimerase/dehydratase family protein [Xylariales sp. AK1849]|nr:NAD dependent epimerase/dehydratase family protein [Xylariales sp. AK1849]